ncbi:NADPH-dependent glutamate synthase [Ruminococcaceae bacterium OttesenSCG-928-N02]|nr:NADPH-dependent glutamate synthase [Ruminococcaceae bacterium OttesenSCG-928-N02]
MANMAKEKTPMPHLPGAERTTTFNEVALGYTPEQAMAEAARCLGCKHKPCVGGCPVSIDIPAFTMQLAAGNFDEAYSILAASTSLPAVCGRVCPQETQCEGVCVRAANGEAVAIGRLERFVADHHAQNSQNGNHTNTRCAPAQKVAVVGSGPAGLSCAGELARLGYAVTIFEALHTAGGVLAYGIPEFRLPKAVVAREITALQAAGVRLETNVVIGKTLLVDELFEQGFAAVFIGSGAGLPRFMGIPGEGLNGVYAANEFLTRVNLMQAYLPHSETPLPHLGKVAVVGGGNVAMDAARAAVRLGAQAVHILYRRSEAELPARREEVLHAKEEGVVFQTLCTPLALLEGKKGFVGAIRCIEMELGTADESGRRRPHEKPGSEFEMDADCVIMAIGTSPNPLIKAATPGIETQRWGGIITDETTATTRTGVFAGGDAVTGAATVISAMGAGKKAAKSIHHYITATKP